jgi:hypothetical protein
MSAKYRSTSSTLPFILALFLATSTAEAAQTTFSPDGIDTTYSLGQFKILVDPSFGGGTFISPLLFDNNTQIQHTQDSANHVTTQILSFDMTDGTFHVLAGSSAPAGTAASYGDVNSINNDGTFPATSTFDIYANILLPTGSFLYNPTGNPLLVNNPNITQFPPDAIYNHSASSAVPVYLHTANATVDPLYGYLSLAGHGVWDTTDPAGSTQHKASDLNEFQALYPQYVSAFQNAFATMPDAPITTIAPSSIPSQFVPLPTTAWLFGSALMGFLGLQKRKGAF